MRDQWPYIAFSIVLVGVLHALAGLPLGYTALAVFVGWPIIGTLITVDDDLPDGWSNPDGTVEPAWKIAENWGYLAFRGALAAAAFAIERATTGTAIRPALMCTVLLLIVALFLVYRSVPKRSDNG